MTKLTPVATNQLFVNVLLQDKVKIRAILDTGSTNTVMSSALYKELKEHGNFEIVPTSNAFKGAAGPKTSYTGAMDSLLV